MLEFDPQIAVSLWLALACVSSAAWLWYCIVGARGLGWYRRFSILAFMLFACGTPLFLLLNPTWVEAIVPPAGRPLVSIVVDATQSMRTKDCGEDDQSRFRAAFDAAERLRESANRRYDVRILRFDQTLTTIDESDSEQAVENRPAGTRTNLSATIRQACNVDRPQGHAVVLLSDGANNVGDSLSVTRAADLANSLNTPIFTSTLGGNVGARNVSISVRNPQLMTFTDRRQNIRVRLNQSGYDGKEVQVSLNESEAIVAKRNVRLSSNGFTETDFSVMPNEAGLFRYNVAVSPVEGEATRSDNRASVQLQVIDEPISVLLIEGKPYWDSKFLARNLAADPSIELTSLIRVREGRYMRRTDPALLGQAEAGDLDDDAPFEGQASQEPGNWSVIRGLDSEWSREENLKQFRVVVLGRWVESFLDDESVKRLKHWISHDGGALICSRGQPTSTLERQLASLLPVRWSGDSEQRARGTLTNLGSSAFLISHQETSGDPLPTLPSLAVAGRPKLAIGLPRVLVQSGTDASGNEVPLISHQPFGSGQTVVVEGAGMWRWAFLPPTEAVSQTVYAELWQGLMQWLISQQDLLPGQELALRSDRLMYVSGDSVTASIVSAEQPDTDIPDVLLEVEGDDLPRRVSPVPSGKASGLFHVDFGKLEAGHYIARLEGLDSRTPGSTTEFDVRDPWFESLDVDARPGLMRQIAEHSGGAMVPAENIDSVVNAFDEFLADSRTERFERTTLWDRPWVLLSVLGLWGTTWALRRNSGLV
ncbi:MAG: hypothetical protein AAF664_05930 [Planctomycetota bacterium]